MPYLEFFEQRSGADIVSSISEGEVGEGGGGAEMTLIDRYSHFVGSRGGATPPPSSRYGPA